MRSLKMNNQEKSVVVIAKEGYNVLLNVGDQVLMIDWYKPVNLSEMFSQDIIDQCTSLQSHLRDGNLVFYTEEKELPKDPNEVTIQKLSDLAAQQQINVEFSQKSGRADAVNIEIETTGVSADVRKEIDKRIEKNRDEIVRQNNKLLEHCIQNTINPDEPVKAGQHMTENELRLNVTMDVDNDVFKAVQEQGQKDITQKAEEDERAANFEIEKRNLENED